MDNVCFDEYFQPTFIDFDRGDSIHATVGLDCFNLYRGSSCMYNLRNPLFDIAKMQQDPSVSTDFMQLGWLAAWLIVDERKGNYHNRFWDVDCEPHFTFRSSLVCVAVAKEVKENRFISELIENKKFDENLLDCLPEDVKTVEDVIRARS